ncbi:MAG: alpha-amylase family glycosyl hydrolase [Actinomycetota bacterium]|nr:alpha-amylase family glycosyl hydrolase [Actinomycetota bacterium]
MTGADRAAPAREKTTGRQAAWWRGSVGYEVYLRSFADADGDGVGDLWGLYGKLDYLAWLGVDLLWVTPFYPSPMLDHGYDVADYCDVDPRYGTLAAVDALVERAHALGLRLLIDLVPNHTSWEHPWFRQARSARDNPYRDYYIWRDPAAGGGPPNNWRSHFGGPAWSFDERTGQWWLHLFLPGQPDLNWANRAVADEFDDILRFWLDRGVDGFRVDVAHALVKHPDLPDNPPARHEQAALMAGMSAAYRSQQHLYDVNQPGVLDIYRRWRKVVDPYGGLLLGEAYVLEAPDLARYVVDQDGLHLAFWFRPLHMDWDPVAVREVLEAATVAAPDSSLAWVQSSHDRPRAVTRFGGGALGRARALAHATLLMGLPGVPFVYQGEELGLADARIAREDARDPAGVRDDAGGSSRDGARTPMLWSPGPGLGFTTAGRPWLPFGDRTDADTVAVQRADPSSTLRRYRRLIRLRRETPDLHTEPVQWVDEAGGVVAYRRGRVLVAANCTHDEAAVELPTGRWRLAFATAGQEDRPEPLAATLRLRPQEAVVAQST